MPISKVQMLSFLNFNSLFAIHAMYSIIILLVHIQFTPFVWTHFILCISHIVATLIS